MVTHAKMARLHNVNPALSACAINPHQSQKARQGWLRLVHPEMDCAVHVPDGRQNIFVIMQSVMDHNAVDNPYDNMNYLQENKFHVIDILKLEVLKMQGSKHEPICFSLRFGISEDWMHVNVTCIWDQISDQLDSSHICFESLNAIKLYDEALHIFTDCESEPLADWDLDEIHRRLMSSFDPETNDDRLHDPMVQNLLVGYLISMAKHYAGGDDPLPAMPDGLLHLCGLGVM